MTELSIIVVCYKGWKRLVRCLESLNNLSELTFSYEVIVVDNNSQDSTFDEIEAQFPRFHFKRNSVNGGFGNGCNTGAGYASGKFLLFLNPDTVVRESELSNLVDVARGTTEFAILSCKQINEYGKPSIVTGVFPALFNITGFQRAVSRLFSFKKEEIPGDIIFPDWVSGSVILMRNDLFQHAGGFDEDYWMYFEDVDICRRIRNLNLQIALCNDITIEHNHGGSSRADIKTTALTKTEVHISRHVYISKHKKGLEKLVIQVFLVTNNLITNGITALAGLLLFFIPRIYSRFLIFIRLFRYYLTALFRRSWISPRSVNFRS